MWLAFVLANSGSTGRIYCWPVLLFEAAKTAKIARTEPDLPLVPEAYLYPRNSQLVVVTERPTNACIPISLPGEKVFPGKVCLAR